MQDINFVATLVAAAAMFFIGMIWYMVFRKPWMKYAGFEGMSNEEMRKMGGPVSYIGAIVVALVTAHVLAHVILTYQATTLSAGLQGGFWMWLGFVATTSLNKVLWEKKPWGLWLLDNGNFLLGFLVAGAILALWPM